MDFSSFTADNVQVDNIAGIRRFWKVLTKSFTGEFPTKAAVVNGEVTVDPLALLPAYFVPAEYVVPQDTKGFDYERVGGDGSEGWKHIVGFEFAGHNKAMVAEMNKDTNAKAVYFMEDTDGQINVVGSSVKGLKLNAKGGSGKMGGDKRGAVFTGEESGFRWIPVPLSAANKDKWLNRLKGYVGVNEVSAELSLPGFSSVNSSFDILFYDHKAFVVGNRVKLAGYFGGSTAATTPFLQGVITAIVLLMLPGGGSHSMVTILGDAINGSTAWSIPNAVMFPENEVNTTRVL